MKRTGFKIIMGLLGLFVLVLFVFNGYPTVNEEDRTYINRFLSEWKIPANPDSIHANFDSEFAFVSKVQDSVLSSIKSVQNPNEEVGHIKHYYQSRNGICYDRAILQEKIFKEYGFEVRHIYVYFNTDSTPTGFTDFFKRNLHSHALFELKTQKGWMAVGTNHNWIGIDSAFNPLTLPVIREKLKNNSFHPLKPSTKGDNFFTILDKPWNFRYVYGIYSRNGEFLESYPVERFQKWVGLKHFMPDYNIRMLLHNF